MMDALTLTDKQFDMVVKAINFPVILKTRGQSITAASLARHGWGQVEPGASGEKIFRLSPDGEAELRREQQSWSEAA